MKGHRGPHRRHLRTAKRFFFRLHIPNDGIDMSGVVAAEHDKPAHEIVMETFNCPEQYAECVRLREVWPRD